MELKLQKGGRPEQNHYKPFPLVAQPRTLTVKKVGFCESFLLCHLTSIFLALRLPQGYQYSLQKQAIFCYTFDEF